MGGITGTLFVAVYLSLVFLATFLFFVRFLRGLKSRAALPYKPIPIVFPAIPVVRTVGVLWIGAMAVAWSIVHLAVVGGWIATGLLTEQTVAVIIAALYSAFAALLVGIGGVALLYRYPWGRNLISWGMVLFSLLAFYGLIICFLLPSLDDVSPELRRIGPIIGAMIVVHLLFDVVVGALGQRVGRPAGWSAEKAIAEQDYATPEITGPGWDDLQQQG